MLVVTIQYLFKGDGDLVDVIYYILLSRNIRKCSRDNRSSNWLMSYVLGADIPVKLMTAIRQDCGDTSHLTIRKANTILITREGEKLICFNDGWNWMKNSRPGTFFRNLRRIFTYSDSQICWGGDDFLLLLGLVRALSDNGWERVFRFLL